MWGANLLPGGVAVLSRESLLVNAEHFVRRFGRGGSASEVPLERLWQRVEPAFLDLSDGYHRPEEANRPE